MSNTRSANHSATVLAVCFVLLLALVIGAVAVWHSGALLSHVPVMRMANGAVDGAMYTVCYGDVLAALEEEGEGENLPDLARERAEALLARALAFYSLAVAEGKTEGYADAARLAAEDATDALRRTASETARSVSEILKARYGRGIKEKDVYRTAEFFAIASLREAELREKLYTPEEREAAFSAHKSEILLADCIAYSVKATYPEGATPDEMREAYLAAEARAQTIAASTGKNTFIANIQADYRKQNPSATVDEVSKMTEKAYRYGITATEKDLVANWVLQADRVAGDTAVLGETGNYTVVFCLAPATRRTESTANVLQMTFPFADRAGRDAAYAEALSLLNGLEGADAFLARAEEVGDVQHLKNTWRAELPYKVAEWLARGPAVDSSYLIEVEDAFLLVCYEGEGELAVWEKQAVFYLQEAELSQLLAADPVEHVKLGKLLLLL